MKIYKLAQDQTPQGTQGESDVIEAIQTINLSLANINKSLQVIEQNDIQNLFNRQTLIAEMQSGNLVSLDVNKIDAALTAMTEISKTVPVLNDAIRIIQTNGVAAQRLQVDINSIQKGMVTTIQSGNYSALVGMLPSFQQMVPSMGGTQNSTL